MIKKGERVALALSGGKDSTTLLYALASLKKDFPFDLIAITIDIGVNSDYHKKILEIARKETKKMETPHYVFSFKNEIGNTLEQLVKKTKTKNPCSYCGVIRRRILNKRAKELGAQKLATAHTLDDSAQTVLMNIIRNEPLRMLRGSRAENNWFVPRIKPFMWFSEDEVIAYGRLKGLPLEAKVCCPYSKNAMRALVRLKLNELEATYPGTKKRILKSSMKIQELLGDVLKIVDERMHYCRRCGEPTAGEKCMYCTMMERVQSQVSL